MKPNRSGNDLNGKGPGGFLRYGYLLLIILWSLNPIHGEEYHYTVGYMGIPLTDVKIEVDTTGSLWEGRYNARIKPLYRRLFKIDNTYIIRAEPDSWKPHSYRKEINEGDLSRSRVYRYPLKREKIIMPDGEVRSFPGDAHNLFSSLLWLQHHHWSANETVSLTVEIDGTFWEATAETEESDEIAFQRRQVDCTVVRVTFHEQHGRYEPPESTDYLSKYLPAQGRVLRFWIDLSTDTVYRIAVPMGPFSVRASLNKIGK